MFHIFFENCLCVCVCKCVKNLWNNVYFLSKKKEIENNKRNTNGTWTKRKKNSPLTRNCSTSMPVCCEPFPVCTSSSSGVAMCTTFWFIFHHLILRATEIFIRDELKENPVERCFFFSFDILIQCRWLFGMFILLFGPEKSVFLSLLWLLLSLLLLFETCRFNTWSGLER